MPGSYLLVGKPGSGKTTAACSLEHPTLLIDIDNKARHMFNIQHLIRSGDVTVLPIQTKLIEDRLSERAKHPERGPLKEPLGYYKIVDILSDISEHLVQYQKYKTVVMDSLTRTVEHLTRLLIYHRAQGKMGKGKGDKDKVDGDMNWPSWGSYKANLEELFNVTTTYSSNFICTAHVQTIEEFDKLTSTSIILAYRPMVDGKMRDKLSSYFDEVYYIENEIKRGQPVKYQFRTVGNKYDASSSMPLPEIVSANLLELVKKYGTVSKLRVSK